MNISASASFLGFLNSNPDYKLKFFEPLSYELFKVCTSGAKAAALKTTDPEPPSVRQSRRPQGSQRVRPHAALCSPCGRACAEAPQVEDAVPEGLPAG
ncbi:hypothetical protein HGRIS_001202 [Hohenbuehelia grisea]|uniref:Uncharacterized protein n=1 Tax=Hohenbuehelia grisea TaxID=104357 RepID=A0ABR3JQS8_9AGAR